MTPMAWLFVQNHDVSTENFPFVLKLISYLWQKVRILILTNHDGFGSKGIQKTKMEKSHRDECNVNRNVFLLLLLLTRIVSTDTTVQYIYMLSIYLLPVFLSIVHGFHYQVASKNLFVLKQVARRHRPPKSLWGPGMKCVHVCQRQWNLCPTEAGFLAWFRSCHVDVGKRFLE